MVGPFCLECPHMPSIQDLADLPVINRKGKRVGTVNHVLFHPSEPKAVGLEVLPKSVGYVVGMPAKYTPLEDVKITKSRVTLGEKGYPSERAVDKRFGFTWDETVIWRHMEVKTRSGRMRGLVQDAHFADDGTVEALSVTSGTTSDAAVGKRNVEGSKIVGFDGEDVIVEDDAATEDDFEGGLAANAGANVAVAKVTAEVAAHKTVAYTKATAKVAAESDTGKKMIGAFKGFMKEARDAMAEDESKDKAKDEPRDSAKLQGEDKASDG
jgi:uncharacterized protein YrrD